MAETKFVEMDSVDAARPEVAPRMLALNEHHLPLISIRVEDQHVREVWACKGCETFTERRRKLL